MTKNKRNVLALAVVCTWMAGCNMIAGEPATSFDDLNKDIAIGNWTYALRVENQSTRAGAVTKEPGQYYLKATLSIGNSKTQKSLLYSSSRDAKDYEAKYKYLSFSSNEDLCIKHGGKIIHPIGYVFEPSNGLSPNERLVYKFALSDSLYDMLRNDSRHIEYWYTDHLIGLGKICFNTNN